jgi:DNA-binding GntR family transcriptional regulator
VFDPIPAQPQKEWKMDVGMAKRPTGDFRAVRGVALAEDVRAFLREAIVTLRYPPGMVIDKNRICDELGVSKFPVTDALSRLQDEGLVDVRARSGTVVSRIKIEDVKQAAFIRASLEIEVVRHLAPSATPQLIQHLERSLQYQSTAITHDDKAGFHEFDLEFHAIILGEFGYPRVQQAISTWRGTLDRARRLNAPDRRQGVILEEHRRIKEALAARDGEAAATAMREHLNAGFNALSNFMLADPDTFDPE